MYLATPHTTLHLLYIYLRLYTKFRFPGSAPERRTAPDPGQPLTYLIKYVTDLFYRCQIA